MRRCMKKNYEQHAEIFMALSDTNRLMILEMLSGKELCACEILEEFEITQPTLSHHMKILCDSGIVKGRKQGKWMFYSLNARGCEKTVSLLKNLTAFSEKENSIGKKDRCI